MLNLTAERFIQIMGEPFRIPVQTVVAIERAHGQAGLVAFARQHKDPSIKVVTVVLRNVPVGLILMKEIELLRQAKPGRARDARLRRLQVRLDNTLSEMEQVLEAKPT